MEDASSEKADEKMEEAAKPSEDVKME